MRTSRETRFVEAYLYGARRHRALEQSVFAEGDRRGFSEHQLLRVAAAMGITTAAGCWELPAAQVSALDVASLASLRESSRTSSVQRVASRGPVAVARRAL